MCDQSRVFLLSPRIFFFFLCVSPFPNPKYMTFLNPKLKTSKFSLTLILFVTNTNVKHPKKKKDLITRAQYRERERKKGARKKKI